MPEAKKVTIETNFNKKLDNDCFCHIQLPWEDGITEKTIIEMCTKDESHPPVKVVVIDSVKQKLSELSASYTYLSHGMEKVMFLAMLQQKAPSIKSDSVLAVYFYKAIKE